MPRGRRPAASSLLAALPPRPPWGPWKIQAFQSFAGGLNLRAANAELQDDELVDAWNFSLSDIGSLTKRGGLTALSTTLPGPARQMVVWTPPGGTKAIYAVATDSGGTGWLLRVDLGTGAVTEIGSGLSATGTPAMIPMAGYLVVLDGTQGWFWDGTTFGALGVDAPTSAVTLAAGTSDPNGPNGEYVYYVTFVRANGMESNPSPVSSALTVTTSDISVSGIATSSDPTVTKRRLYRNGGNTAGIALMVTEIADNTTTAYTDTASDASLIGNEVLSFSNGAPPTGLTIGAVYNGRMWASTGADSQLYYSEVLSPWAWGDGANYTEISPDQSGSISGVFPIASQLLVFKPQSVWAVNGYPPANFTVSQTVVPQGCMAPFSVAMTPSGVTFLAQDGVYWTNGYTGDVMQDDQDPMRRNKIEPLLVSIDYTQPVVGIYFDRTYYLFCTGNGTGQTFVILFDFRHGSWVLYDWTCISAAVDLETGTIYVGMQADGTIAMANSGTADLGQDINVYAATKGYDMGSPSLAKAFKAVWVEGGDTSAQPQIQVTIDDGAQEYTSTVTLTNPQELVWDVGAWDAANWGGGETAMTSFMVPDAMTGRRVSFGVNETSQYPLRVMAFQVQWRPDKVVY